VVKAPLCVVVGAGPGLGASVARRFVKEGFAIGLIGRDVKSVGPVVEAFSAEEGRVVGLAADASDARSLAPAISSLTSTIGDVEVLVYNAVSFVDGPASNLDGERLTSDFRTSVVGALLATQTVVAAMRARKRGTIILTGGGAAIYPGAAWASLSVTKSALRSLAYALHEELKPAGVHVVTVTIEGAIGSSPRFMPDVIAEATGIYTRLRCRSGRLSSNTGTESSRARLRPAAQRKGMRPNLIRFRRC